MKKSRDKETLDKQVAGLRASSAEINRKTLVDVHKSIDSMKRRHMKINFKTVAKESKFSRATLYNNDQLKERILSLQAISNSIPLDGVIAVKKEIVKLQEEKIAALRKRVKALEEDKVKLIDQLVEMEKLKEENKSLRNRKHKLD